MKKFPWVLVIAVIFCSCEKFKPTIASVVVRNTSGQVVPGAQVILHGTGSNSGNAERFNITLTTDGSGKAVYDFSEYYKQGQSGFAVLDITASKGNLNGAAIIRVEPEETTEESVVVE